MLWSLAEPIALLGLLAAFVAALLLREAVQTAIFGPHTRRARWSQSLDPFGTVAALLGGAGWGRRVSSQDNHRRALLGLLAGPASALLASQLAFLAYRATGGASVRLRANSATDILRGIPGPVSAQFLLSFGVGLCAFGIVALLPIPPLDGWGLLRYAMRHRAGFAPFHYWLDEQNVGVVVLLAGLVVPLSGNVPILLHVVDWVIAPVLWAWS